MAPRGNVNHDAWPGAAEVATSDVTPPETGQNHDSVLVAIW